MIGRYKKERKREKIDRSRKRRKKIVTENSQRIPGWSNFPPSANTTRGMQRQIR